MRFLLFVLCFIAELAHSSIYLGAGVGGTTSGRSNLALVLSLDSADASVSGYMAGVQNAYYYQSDYFIAYNRKIVGGDLWWGSLTGMFGGGIFYSERGLRNSSSGDLADKKNDFIIGPTINFKWAFAGPVYFVLDAIYGLRDPWDHIQMSFQDVELLSLGVAF